MIYEGRIQLRGSKYNYEYGSTYDIIENWCNVSPLEPLSTYFISVIALFFFNFLSTYFSPEYFLV